jgi:hypothetical protein
VNDPMVAATNNVAEQEIRTLDLLHNPKIVILPWATVGIVAKYSEQFKEDL